MKNPSNGTGGALPPAPLTDREIVRRILRAGLREEPGPYRVGLGLRAWERIKDELRQAELAELARYHGQE